MLNSKISPMATPTNNTNSAPAKPNPPTSTSNNACPTSPPPKPICAASNDVLASAMKLTATICKNVSTQKKRMTSASGRSQPMSGRMSIESSKSQPPKPAKKNGARNRPQPKRTERMRVHPSNTLPLDKLNAPNAVSTAIRINETPTSCSCCAGVSEKPVAGALRVEPPRGRGREDLLPEELPC